MRAGRGEANDHVAGLGAAAIENLRLVDDADTETREVVVVAVIHARHLGGLAADQGAAGTDTAFGDAADDALGSRHVERAGRVVIEKEERFCTADDDVIDAHGDQIDADGGMALQVDRQSQLRAHAVGPGDQHRLGIVP